MNLMFQHKISIIVPVYNVENYVSTCIESIINQNYKNLEIILVNDGSTDKSGYICDYYAKKDERIVVIHQKNQGLSMSRNNALDIASGDYIGFVDSDGWIASDMYYTLYNNAIKYNADIAMCNFYYVNQNRYSVIDDDEKFIIDENNSINKIILKNDDKMTHYFDFNTYNVVVWNKLYRRTIFNEIRYPRNKIFEDIFTTHKLIEKANKIVIIPDYKYYCLFRNDSMRKSLFAPNQLDRIEACIDRYNYIAPKYPTLENIWRN